MAMWMRPVESCEPVGPQDGQSPPAARQRVPGSYPCDSAVDPAMVEQGSGLIQHVPGGKLPAVKEHMDPGGAGP